METIQILLVVVAIGGALVFLIRRGMRNFRKTSACGQKNGCGGSCGGCSAKIRKT